MPRVAYMQQEVRRVMRPISFHLLLAQKVEPKRHTRLKLPPALPKRKARRWRSYYAAIWHSRPRRPASRCKTGTVGPTH